MKFIHCPRCGGEVESTEGVCPYCGRDLAEDAQNRSASTEAGGKARSRQRSGEVILYTTLLVLFCSVLGRGIYTNSIAAKNTVANAAPVYSTTFAPATPRPVPTSAPTKSPTKAPTQKPSYSSSTFSGSSSDTLKTGEYWCMGKNDTCKNKTYDPFDYFCSSCDKNNNNIEDRFE